MLRRLAATGWPERIPRLGWLLLSAGAAVSGCAHSSSRTASHSWQNVPSISWARPSEAKADSEQESEPTVAANAPSEKTEAKPSEGASRLFRWSSLTGGKTQVATGEEAKAPAQRTDTPQDPFLEEELLAQVRKMEEEEEDPPLRTRRARIKAALNDDSRSAQNLALAKQEEDQLKLRVEALSDRARQLLDEGDLQAAQRTAELAQSLVQTGELEFAPEEQRPVDLLAKINQQLESESPQSADLLSDELTEADDQFTAERDPSSPENQVSLTGKSETAADFPEEFDPFAKPEALAESRDNSNHTAEAALVVLGSPNFDDESADETTGIDGSLPEQPPSVGRSQAIAELSALHHRSTKRIRPMPVDFEGDFTETVPQPPEAEVEDPPSPPPHVTAEIASQEPLPEPDVFGMEDEEPADIRPADVWPRWMPISGLCLLAGAFGVWFWRKRLALRS